MWLLAACAALARSVTVDAEADPAAGLIRGTLRLDAATTLTNPLASMPVPEEDRAFLRTFPDDMGRGLMAWQADPSHPEIVSFTTRLPTRYGPTGAWGGALLADGAWLPVVTSGADAPEVLDWDVRVRAPSGARVVVNGATDDDGDGVVSWRGRADRVALAVLGPSEGDDGAPVVEEIEGVRVLGVRPMSPARRRWLAEAIRGAGVVRGARDVMIVRIADFERLARPAPGLVFLSERAFRVTGPVAAYHLGAVRRALVAAAVPLADGQQRDFVAAPRSSTIPSNADASRLLRWFAWNPVVEAILHDGTLPFYADVFGVPCGAPAGAAEAMDPRPCGASIARQLDTLRGPGSAAIASDLLLDGANWPDVMAALGVPAEVAAAWQKARPVSQDYRVVGFGTDAAHVAREAPAAAPAEVVVVRVDGADAPWIAGPGPDAYPVPSDARSVRVDPDGSVAEVDRGDDAAPARWSVLASGFVSGLSPTQRNADVSLDLAWRRTGGTRGLSFASLGHDARDLVSVSLGHTWTVGPLVDRRLRAHRLTVYGGPSLLDPAFRATGSGEASAFGATCGSAWALDGAFGWTWDTRTDRFAPLDGHRVSASLGGGFVPNVAGDADPYGTLGASAVLVRASHPRVVWVGRVRGGAATGDVEHRLLQLGGASDVRALANDAFVGNARVVAGGELRLVALRNVSVPGPLGWLSELHVTPGLDLGIAWRAADEAGAWAAGATLGVHGAFDVLGARPSYGGVTVAIPVDGTAAPGRPAQVYLDLGHPF